MSTGRVIVIGGSGLIGRRLVPALAERGHEVVVLSRRPQAVAGLPAGCRAVGWDGVSAHGWGSELEGAAAVVNLAGEGVADERWTTARKGALRDSRVKTTAAVVAAFTACAQRPPVLLQGSAVGFYGPRGNEEVGEEQGAGDDFLARLCVEWEAASAPVEELGVRRVLLRTGIVLDPAGGALAKMVLPFRLFAGGPLGSGAQYLPWIHWRDEAAAIEALLTAPDARGAYNLTAPAPMPQRDFARELGRVLHRPSLLPTPGFALRLALGELAEVLLTGQRAVPRRLLAAGLRFEFPDLPAALADLYP